MSASKAEKGPTNLSEERREVLENMSRADSTIGAKEVVTPENTGGSEKDPLAWMSPEARENAEAILMDMGGVAVAPVVEVTPDVLRHEVFEVDGVTPLPADDYSEMSSMGIDDISEFLSAEASVPGSTIDSHPASIVEADSDGGSMGGGDSEVAVSSPADEPTPVSEVAPAVPTAREKYLAEESARIAGSVDDIMKSSRGIATIERVKAARAEKQHRIDVRQTNKGGVKQEVRDAKLNLKITEQTYNRSGKRFLRRLEREKMKSEIDKRRADGTMNRAQATLAKIGTRKKARSHIEGQAVKAIAKAEGKLQETKDNKDKFSDNYGRRNNSTRKNYQRVRARIATGANYRGAGEVVTTPSTTLGEMWASDEWTKKRAEAVKRKEAEEKARALAVRKKWEAENPVYGPARPVAKTRHARPVATRPATKPTPRVRITGPRESFS